MIRIKIRKEIDRKKYLLFAILSFVIVLAAWLIASESGAIKEIFLPKPQNVVRYYIAVSYTHLDVYKRQVYGMEGPGGYQFVGRTIQMWNPLKETEYFKHGTPWLFDFHFHAL